MRKTQSLASFNDYLISLRAQRDRLTSDKESMKALRDRVIESILLEAMKKAIQSTTYAALLQQYQGIEQRLRRTNELPALEKSHSDSKSGSQKGSEKQHQPAKDQSRNSTPSASQGRKLTRSKPAGGDSASKNQKPLAEVQCYDCKQYGHYKNSPKCPNSIANEARNQNFAKKKGKI